MELGEVFAKVNDAVEPSSLEVTLVEYVGLENISQGTGELIGETNTNPREIKSLKTNFKPGDILYGKLRPNLNKVYHSEILGICSTDIFVLRGHLDKVYPKLYAFYFLSDEFNAEVLKGIKGAQLPRVGFDSFSKIKIPLPDLPTQARMVAAIERERALVAGCRELMEVMEEKVRRRVAGVWGE